MIEPGHEFDHGAARRAKRGDSRHNKPTKKADDRWLVARQTRQPVNPCDHAGMNVVRQHSVVQRSRPRNVRANHGAGKREMPQCRELTRRLGTTFRSSGGMQRRVSRFP